VNDPYDPLGGLPDAEHLEGLSGLLGEGLARRLERWAADARIDEAARRRARERWLEQQAREEATLLGILADLAERGTVVTLQLRSARPRRGRVRLIGADFVALAPVGDVDGRGGEVLVVMRAVVAVGTQPGEPVSIGDRSVRSRMTLTEVVIGLAGDRERAVLVLAGSEEVVRGTLWSVGQDVVVMRVDGEAIAATVYVPLDAISQLTID
jgi:hypothetical protein